MPQHRSKKQADKLPRRQAGASGAPAQAAADDGSHAWQRSQGAFSAKAKKVSPPARGTVKRRWLGTVMHPAAASALNCNILPISILQQLSCKCSAGSSAFAFACPKKRRWWCLLHMCGWLGLLVMAAGVPEMEAAAEGRSS